VQSHKHQKDYLKCDLVTFASKVEAQIESETKDLHLHKSRLLKETRVTQFEKLIKYRNMNTILDQTVKITRIDNMQIKKNMFKSNSDF